MENLSSTAEAPAKRAAGASIQKSTRRPPKNSSRQWTIKGLSPEVVEVSRDAARRSGMRLNTWVGAALEQAAEQHAERRPAKEEIGDSHASMEAILAELVQLRPQVKELESTVNSMSTILVKLLAERLQSES